MNSRNNSGGESMLGTAVRPSRPNPAPGTPSTASTGSTVTESPSQENARKRQPKSSKGRRPRGAKVASEYPEDGNVYEDEGTNARRNGPRGEVYKSPPICCCDLQSALTCMAVLDLVIAFIFLIVFANALSSHSAPRHYHGHGHGHGHGHVVVHRRFYHHHHPIWRFRRQAPTTTTQPPVTSTKAPEEEERRIFYGAGLAIALIITIASIFLLCGAIGRSKVMNWISTITTSLIFVAASVIYCLYVFGNDDAAGSWPYLVAIALILIYRIYEGVVVYYFNKEPPPPPVRYVATESPDVIYESAYVPVANPYYGGGYYGGPYYGPGYGYGYGYGPGVGVATGLGLGLALGGGFHDHYDYYDHYDYI